MEKKIKISKNPNCPFCRSRRADVLDFENRPADGYMTEFYVCMSCGKYYQITYKCVPVELIFDGEE